MNTLHNSSISWINQPYFDLGSFKGGPPHLHGIEFCYNHLIENVSMNYGVQVNFSSTFRESLINETKMTQYQIKNPLELPSQLRTERWEKLCDHLVHYNELQSDTKLKTMNLLRSLCLHHAVVEYIPIFSETEIAADANIASLAWCRSISSSILMQDSSKKQDLSELEKIAIHASKSRLKIGAAIQLVVHYAKSYRDIEKAQFWRETAHREIQELKSSIDDFDYNLLMSIYYRAVSFVPLLRAEQEVVVHEMDLCQSYGESLINNGNNEIQKIIANENLNILLESRTKEALWLKDLDLAHERTQRLIQMEPLDPRYYLEFGEILMKQGKFEEAAKTYRSAVRLGPPGTVVAWFMAGQCYEALGELDLACDCYLACLQIDSEAICAVERLVKIVRALGNPVLETWSKLRLEELQDRKQQLTEALENKPIREATTSLRSSQ